MADVIVRGMEMPENCNVCPFIAGCSYCGPRDGGYEDHCPFDTDEHHGWYFDIGCIPTPRPDWCPLEPAPEWISVEERLPDPEETVLVVCHNAFVPSEKWVRIDKFVCGKWLKFNHTLITHWMPLPKTPEEGKI